MRTEDAEQLMAFLRAAFPRMEPEQQILYARLLEKESDVDLVSRAILKGVNEWKYPPSFSELRDYIRLEKRLSEPEPYLRETTTKREMPQWVKRWVCARFLYERFGQEQDMRPLREQSSYADPLAEYMGDEDWLPESARVSTEEAWAAINTATGVTQ